MNRSTSRDSNALKRTESYQYPSAHSNHLNSEQQHKLDLFKELCTKEGYYRPTSGQQPSPSHDDETLLRYLRARKFVPADAFKQFKDTEDWRKTNEIDKLYDTIDISEYDETRRLYPQWTGRRDKRGIPVYVFEIAGLNSKRMSEYQSSLSSKASKSAAKGSVSPNLRRLFALYENLIQFVMPLCSALPSRPFADTPVSQSNNIVDISKTGPRQFWNLKNHMQEASQLATAHYPETLDRIFIIGAPSFFPTVWSWIKRWFDPVTVSKIFIVAQNDVYKTLSEYIEPENIPKKYGGTLDWDWGQLPSLDPEVSSVLSWKNPVKGDRGSNVFPLGPVRWKTSSDGQTMTAVALGTENGKQREEAIATIPLPEGGIINQIASRPALDRIASRTGVHTHPAEGIESFPKTGETPADTPTGSDAQSVSSSRIASNANLPSNELDFAKQQNPTSATERRDQVRQGTSSMRQEAQTGTHAEGVQSHATPAVVDHGHGDKSHTMEPGTIGQAPKDVAVPDAKTESGKQEQEQGSYVDQAKSAVGGAAATVSSLSADLASKVGLGGGKSEEEQEREEGERARQQESQKQDPEIDRMGDVEVEDFIRNKYATHQNPSAKVQKGSDE